MQNIADIFKIFTMAGFICASLLAVLAFFRDAGLLGLSGFLSPNKRSRSVEDSETPEITENRTDGHEVPGSKNTIAIEEPELKNKTSEFFSIAGIVLLSRAFIYLVGYIGFMLIKNQKLDFIGSFQMLWNKWDSSHYLHIAQYWYTNTGDERNFLVFYPLYPLLVKTFSFIFRDYFLSGIILSNICLIIAAYYLYKLVTLELGKKWSGDAVKFLLVFPFSFFYGIAYTESLFIALTIMSVYHMRTKNWFGVGVTGFLAAMTKNFGILLVIPAVIEYLLSEDIISYLKNRRFKEIASSLWKNGLNLCFIPFGTILYLMINKRVTGNWFEFLKIQKEHWNNSFGFFAENVKNHFLNALNYEPNMSLSLWWPQVITFVFAMLLVFYSAKKLRSSYTLYMLAYILITFSPTWLLSGPRYISGLFPVYMLLAVLAKNRWVNMAVTMVSILLLAVYTVAFVLGYSVM